MRKSIKVDGSKIFGFGTKAENVKSAVIDLDYKEHTFDNGWEGYVVVSAEITLEIEIYKKVRTADYGDGDYDYEVDKDYVIDNESLTIVVDDNWETEINNDEVKFGTVDCYEIEFNNHPINNRLMLFTRNGKT